MLASGGLRSNSISSSGNQELGLNNKKDHDDGKNNHVDGLNLSQLKHQQDNELKHQNFHVQYSINKKVCKVFIAMGAARALFRDHF